MEIEAKFRVADAAVFAALRATSQLAAFHFDHVPQPELQHNVYYDTADQRLRAQRHGLRVRQIGPRQIATLKGPAQFDDGLFSRGEWEADVASDALTTWPAGELRDRVQALVGDGALRPIVDMRTTREHIYALHGAAQVAELSLDDGIIAVGNHTEHFRELEIELISGAARADFDELVQLLRARFALVAEPHSKLERGLALYDKG